jgi:ubiquinone/menaquinone biosynthesis C-methylase UbiE
VFTALFPRVHPGLALLRLLQRKAGDQALAAHVPRTPAEDLPFEDGTFDAVVSTLVLCGVDDQPRALRELRRVLRPDGQVLFLGGECAEQGRAERDPGRWPPRPRRSR